MKAPAKILIIGGNSFVGSALARALAPIHKVTATYQHDYTPIKGVDFIQGISLDNKDRGKDLIMRLEPDAVICCAGQSDYLFCELDANLRNIQISHAAVATNLVPPVDTLKAKFIYISSDFVFSGVDGNFAESDTAIPSYQLGKAKLSSENFIRGRCLNHVIIRSAPLIGRGPMDHPSWIDKIREPLMHGKPIKLPAKIVHNPVHISLLVSQIQEVLINDVRNKTLHLGGLSRVSDFEFARIFASQFGYDPALVEQSDESAQTAAADYSLNFTETLKIIKMDALYLEQSLALLKN